MTEVISQILAGITTTLEIFALTLFFSLPLGVVVALGRLSKYKIVSGLTQFYIWSMRGTPLMLQLIFVYFGLGSLGLNIPRFFAVVLTFVVNYAAYFAEIFRGGIQTIDRVQFESSETLGLSYWQTMKKVILPQAIKRVLPPVSNEVIALIKDTSLAQIIGIIEIFSWVKITAARDFVLYPFLIAAIFYLLMTYLITNLFNRLESYYTYYQG